MPTPADAANPARSAADIATGLTRLPGWSGGPDAVRRMYRFPSFLDAVRFMSACADAIDRLGHHPDWRNVYDRVEVTLTTHDAGDRVTGLDLDLAALLDVQARALGGV